MVFIKVAISLEAAPIQFSNLPFHKLLKGFDRTIRFGYFANQEMADFLEENSM